MYGFDMAVEIAAVVEGLVAGAALEGPRPRVNAGVDHKVLPAAEQLPANAAHLHRRTGRWGD